MTIKVLDGHAMQSRGSGGHLARLLPDNERIIIENAGHEMFLDNAEGSNQAIIHFLTK